jgi:hypothetical protein
MVSSGLLRRVALVRTDVSEEPTYAAKKYHLVFLRSIRQLLVAACAVPSSPIFVTLMKEAPGSSETSVLTRATWRNNPEDTILYIYIFVKLQVTEEMFGSKSEDTTGIWRSCLRKNLVICTVFAQYCYLYCLCPVLLLG